MGMKLMKVLMMHMNMRWCMHIQDHHHLDPDHDHDDELMMMKSKRIRSKSSSSSKKIIKVVKWEGGMKTYSRPIKVGEVIMDSPKHKVCRSDTLYIGQKIPPLPENQVLRPGNTYFLVPSHLFQSALSFVTVASVLSAAAAATSRAGAATSNSSDINSIEMILKKERQQKKKKNKNKKKKKKMSLESCQPFIIQKSASGCSRMRVSDEFLISKIVDDGDEDEDEDDVDQLAAPLDHLCTTPQLQKEYVQLVQSRTQWKPNLPTIIESATATATPTPTPTPTTARRRPPIPRRKRTNIVSSNSLIMPPVHNNVSHVPLKSSDNSTIKGHRKIKIFKSRKSSSCLLN